MAMSHRQPNLFRTLLSLFKGEPHELLGSVQSQHAMLALVITMVMPEVRLCFCGLFSPWFSKTTGQQKAVWKGRSVRMRRLIWALASTRKFFLSIFWRTGSIACLVEYPEKTDRLEQRQAAGKSLKRPFLLWGPTCAPVLDRSR